MSRKKNYNNHRQSNDRFRHTRDSVSKKQNQIRRTSSINSNPIFLGYLKIRKTILYLENDPLVRLAIIGVFLITLFQITTEISDSRDEREFRQEERISRAWENLLDPRTSDRIRSNALQFLFDSGESFNNIDLSCESLGRSWDSERVICNDPIEIDSVDLGSPNSINISYVEKSTKGFSDMRLTSTWSKGCLSEENKKEGASFQWFKKQGESNFDALINDKRRQIRERGVNFKNANLSGIRFKDSVLSGADFTSADLRGAYFETTVIEAGNFKSTNIEGATFKNTYLMGSSFFKRANFERAHARQANINIYDVVQVKAQSNFIISWMDGIEMGILDQIGLVNIRNSSLRNSKIRLLNSPAIYGLPYCLGEGGDCGVSGFEKKTIISDSALDCAEVFDDTGLVLFSNELSNTRFPERVFIDFQEFERFLPEEEILEKASFPPLYADVISKEPELVLVSGVLDPAGWGDEVDEMDNLFAGFNWAWTDRPPIGNIYGEKVVSCPSQRRTNEKVSVGARNPCFESYFNDFNDEKKHTFFSFPYPDLKK